MTYTHLRLEEREKLYALKEQGTSLQKIGKKLGRSVGTISRELKRNAKYGAAYLPCRAQRLSDKRGWRQRYKAPLKNPLVFLYVRKHLRENNWSPDEIAGRLPLDHPGQSVSYETIYRYVYSKKMQRYQYWQYLTLGRRKRMSKGGRRVRNEYSGKIPGSVSIDLRPKETDAVVKRLKKFPKRLRKTVTEDNGAENSYHNENTNGRIRRFIPKGVSIDDIPDDVIEEIERKLNATPRKKLGYLTPYEKMNEVLKALPDQQTVALPL